MFECVCVLYVVDPASKLACLSCSAVGVCVISLHCPVSCVRSVSFLHPGLLSSVSFYHCLGLSRSVSGVSVAVQPVSLMVMGLIGYQGCWKDRE